MEKLLKHLVVFREPKKLNFKVLKFSHHECFAFYGVKFDSNQILTLDLTARVTPNSSSSSQAHKCFSPGSMNTVIRTDFTVTVRLHRPKRRCKANPTLAIDCMSHSPFLCHGGQLGSAAIGPEL